MSVQISDFVGEVAIKCMSYRAYATRAAELNTIATALSSDTTKHDKTIEAAPVGLQAGNAANTPFTNAILLIVNKGKGGGLTPTQMSNAITGGLSQFNPPVNTTAPALTGTGTVGQTLTCTNGIWTYVPTGYTYQWTRGGSVIAGAFASTYVLVAADSGNSIVCRVTAINAAGSTVAPSNAIVCA